MDQEDIELSIHVLTAIVEETLLQIHTRKEGEYY